MENDWRYCGECGKRIRHHEDVGSYCPSGCWSEDRMDKMKLGVITERENGETCGAWKRPDWKPDKGWFRCRTCGFVIPESLFDGANLPAAICGKCLRK